MTNAYIGEIRLFGNNFAPRDWATCDGQILSIAQNSALFAIIGTYYGGDGRVTFGLPNFQGRTGLDQGQGPSLSPYVVGEMTGSPSVTLITTEMPMHNHVLTTESAGAQSQNKPSPSATAFLGNSGPASLYNDQVPSPSTMLAPQTIGIAGGSLPHDNMQPYLAILFCICLYGIFPSRN
jgi:microcystin-dependent protein